MKLITNIDEYYDAISSVNNDRKFLYMSSFGFSWNKETQEMIKNLHPDMLLIGISFTECTPGCQNCIAKNKRKYAVTKEFADFAHFAVKITDKLHLKLVLTDKEVIVGGMNISDSGWSDSAVLIKDKKLIKEYKKHFENIWDQHDNIIYDKNQTEYIFTFGKYKGKTYSEILETDKEYINWSMENIEWFKKEVNKFENDL